MKAKQWLIVAGVSVAAFVFNCSEIMPVGLLTDIGDSFEISESQTAMLVSVYAWFVMIFSVPLMILGTRLNFRPLLLCILAVFTAGQILTAVSVNFWMMMASRLVVAAAHCVFWAIGGPLSVRLVDAKHRAAALSAFEMGSAAALVLGLPIGRTVGLMVGWRATFALVGLIAAVLLVYNFIMLPNVKSEEAYKFSQFPELFKNPALVAIFVLTALYALSYYVGYSYIEPFMLQVANMGEEVITLALAVFGVAGVLGCVCASRLYPKLRFGVVGAATIGVPLALFLMSIFAQFGSSALILFACVIWGFSGALVAVTYQGEIINVAKDSQETVATAFFSGIFNFGIGFGAYLGGRVVDSVGITHVCNVGALIGIISISFCLIIALRQLKKFEVKL